MSAPLLGREQILAVLRDLADELDRQGVRAEVFLVGGAAMTLAYDTRRTTRDIDAVFEPKGTVYEAARRVAGRHGLPEDWLNDVRSRVSCCWVSATSRRGCSLGSCSSTSSSSLTMRRIRPEVSRLCAPAR